MSAASDGPALDGLPVASAGVAAPRPSGLLRGQLPGGLAVLLIAPLLVLLAFAFFAPILRILAASVLEPRPGLSNYARLLSQPLYMDVIVRTLWISGACTVLALLLGYPVAVLMARTRGGWATVIAACVLVPLWTSTLVRSYAWILLLDRNGILNGLMSKAGLIGQPLDMLYGNGAVLMAMTHMLMPFVILPIYSALQSIPPELGQAATNLGAGPVRRFWSVTLPLSLPGVSAGCLLVFVMALGFYVTPALLGGPKTLMIATLISQQATELLNWPFAGAISGVLLALSLGIAVTFKRWLDLGRVVAHD